MNEPIIKESLFPNEEQKAYKRYCEQAKEYTIPMTFDEWLKEVKNFKFGC